MPSTTTTILWAAPADECLLRALNGEASPGAAGAEAALVSCTGVPQGPEDHELRRVSQEELSKLWKLGACRDKDGLPLLGHDGKLVCAFGEELVKRAKAAQAAAQERRREEAEVAAAKLARKKLADFAPKLTVRKKARRLPALAEAERRRREEEAKFRKRHEAYQAHAHQMAELAMAQQEGTPQPWGEAASQLPLSPASHPEVHGEEPPEPARLPEPETEKERQQFEGLKHLEHHHSPPPVYDDPVNPLLGEHSKATPEPESIPHDQHNLYFRQPVQHEEPLSTGHPTLDKSYNLLKTPEEKQTFLEKRFPFADWSHSVTFVSLGSDAEGQSFYYPIPGDGRSLGASSHWQTTRGGHPLSKDKIKELQEEQRADIHLLDQRLSTTLQTRPQAAKQVRDLQEKIHKTFGKMYKGTPLSKLRQYQWVTIPHQIHVHNGNPFVVEELKAIDHSEPSAARRTVSH